ncbi:MULTISPECIES: hypothetical protein [Bacteroidota]|uniref:hypothetical protein n=1 Tax=Bacteroidota TaxID=976 RepID=UPI00241E8DD4|nr:MULTISPECIES: hypothetical protein [Bacteroidota]
MKDTIGSSFEHTTGQIFRITYKNRDFQLRLMRRGLARDVSEIDLLIDGVIHKLIKREGIWFFEKSDENRGFANDIWRAISLRYRL